MKLFLDHTEVTPTELKYAFDNLKCCEPDGGSYESITLEDIDENENMYFETGIYSTF